MHSVGNLLVVTVLCLGYCLGAKFNRGLNEQPVFGVPGGWSDGDPTAEYVKDIARFFVEAFSQENGINYHIRVGEILKVRTQVVAGMNYKITVVLEHTACPAHPADNSEASCPTTDSQTCEAKIYERSWENIRELTSYTCQ